MKEAYSAVIKQSGSWWIDWIEEVPGGSCQEATRQECRSKTMFGNSPGITRLKNNLTRKICRDLGVRKVQVGLLVSANP